MDVDERLVRLLESQKLATNEVRQYTDEEKKIREQILSQYSQTEIEDEFEAVESDGGEGGGATSKTLVKNTNAADVQARIKEKRENAKLESAMKKQKDKEDREKNKKLREEKKEKRKTVKGERRRWFGGGHHQLLPDLHKSSIKKKSPLLSSFSSFYEKRLVFYGVILRLTSSQLVKRLVIWKINTVNV